MNDLRPARECNGSTRVLVMGEIYSSFLSLFEKEERSEGRKTECEGENRLLKDFPFSADSL